MCSSSPNAEHLPCALAAISVHKQTCSVKGANAGPGRMTTGHPGPDHLGTWPDFPTRSDSPGMASGIAGSLRRAGWFYVAWRLLLGTAVLGLALAGILAAKKANWPALLTWMQDNPGKVRAAQVLMARQGACSRGRVGTCSCSTPFSCHPAAGAPHTRQWQRTVPKTLRAPSVCLPTLAPRGALSAGLANLPSCRHPGLHSSHPRPHLHDACGDPVWHRTGVPSLLDR